ncbi:MAG: hypothetical protein E7211_13390 [Clostridium lundense]|nr:hypothetical protein [Clostridium lundense]
MNLEQSCSEYRELSQKIINKLKNNMFDDLNDLFTKREIIINQIFLYCREEEKLRELYGKYDLFKLDEIMKLEFQSKKKELKRDILNLKRRREAAKSYNNINLKSVFLSRKL